MDRAPRTTFITQQDFTGVPKISFRELVDPLKVYLGIGFTYNFPRKHVFCWFLSLCPWLWCLGFGTEHCCSLWCSLTTSPRLQLTPVPCLVSTDTYNPPPPRHLLLQPTTSTAWCRHATGWVPQQAVAGSSCLGLAVAGSSCFGISSNSSSCSRRRPASLRLGITSLRLQLALRLQGGCNLVVTCNTSGPCALTVCVCVCVADHVCGSSQAGRAQTAFQSIRGQHTGDEQGELRGWLNAVYAIV